MTAAIEKTLSQSNYESVMHQYVYFLVFFTFISLFCDRDRERSITEGDT